MSDISRFLPTAGLSNIAQAGANRLASAQSDVSKKLSQQSLARSIEAGLGGMKMTTFGSKVFSGIEKEGGAYLKQQVGRLQGAAKDAAGNAWESAKDAITGRDPIQMDTIGDVDAGGGAAADAGGGAATDAGFAARASNLGGRISNLQSRLQGAGDTPPPRPTAPKPKEDAPELPDPATKPSPAELVEPETAAAGEQGGVASLASSEGGLITGSEALSGILEATGVGAPLGLIIGAVGVGLALKKDKPVTVATSSADSGGYSYQMGI